MNNRGTRKICLTFALCAIMVHPLPVSGCIICIAVPTRTMADYLIDSDIVVFAREGPDTPFAYQITEILKGGCDDRDTGLFVNSTNRRILAANPNKVVVLVRNDGIDSWRNLGIADDEFQAVVRRVLFFAKEWGGEIGSSRRLNFFLPLFSTKNRSLFEQAYLELGRAPYSNIKKMATTISREEIRPMLVRREYIRWRALAILLLAQNADENDKKLIVDRFRTCRQYSLTNNLAAWTTAYIELHQSIALEEISESYLSSPGRSPEEIRSIINSLSVHGNDGHVHLRDQIVELYGVALKNHPGLADLMVNDLSAWKRLEYRAEVRMILKNSGIEFERDKLTILQKYVQ